MEAETKKAAVQMTALGRSLLAACGRLRPLGCCPKPRSRRKATVTASFPQYLANGSCETHLEYSTTTLIHDFTMAAFLQTTLIEVVRRHSFTASSYALQCRFHGMASQKPATRLSKKDSCSTPSQFIRCRLWVQLEELTDKKTPLRQGRSK